MDAQLESGTHKGSQGHSHCLLEPYHLAELCSLLSAPAVCVCGCVCLCVAGFLSVCLIAFVLLHINCIFVFELAILCEFVWECLCVEKERTTKVNLGSGNTHSSYTHIKNMLNIKNVITVVKKLEAANCIGPNI